MEKLKKRINTIGKVCRILSLILMIIMIVGTSAIVISGTVLAVLPHDLAQADVKAQSQIEVSGRVIDEIPQESAEKIAVAVKDGAFSTTINAQKVESVEKVGQKIVLNAESGTMTFTLRRLGLALLPLALLTGSLIVVFIFLGKMMRQLEQCETPFCDGVVSSMRAFAFSLIPFAVVKPVATSLFSGILFSGDVSIHLGRVDFGVVFTVLVIFLLVTIFKYGVKLQQESDETL